MSAPWTEPRSTPRRCVGFTLIEIMVAIAIFALVAAIGYGGLKAVSQSRFRITAAADRLVDVLHTVDTFSADLEQAVARSVRDEYGEPRPAMLAKAANAGTFLELSRAGNVNPLGLPRSTLVRVAYRLVDDRLLRLQWNVLDRSPDSAPRSTTLLNGVDALEVRYLDQQLHWHAAWPPGEPGETDADALPRGVELHLQIKAWGGISRLIGVAD